MGTRPFSWQMRAERARSWAATSIARSVGAGLHVDLERGAPLGKAGALLVVLGGALIERVETGAPVLARDAAGEGLEAGVDLDARDDAVGVQHVDEWLAA